MGTVYDAVQDHPHRTVALLGAALAGLGRRPEAEKLLASSASALATSSDAPAEVKSKAQERASSLLR